MWKALKAGLWRLWQPNRRCSKRKQVEKRWERRSRRFFVHQQGAFGVSCQKAKEPRSALFLRQRKLARERGLKWLKGASSLEVALIGRKRARADKSGRRRAKAGKSFAGRFSGIAAWTCLIAYSLLLPSVPSVSRAAFPSYGAFYPSTAIPRSLAFPVFSVSCCAEQEGLVRLFLFLCNRLPLSWKIDGPRESEIPIQSDC